MIKLWALAALLLVAACSGSPTSPTPQPITNVPPPVVIAPPNTPTSNPLLSDPRFDRNFYRQLALDGFQTPQLRQLARWTRPPFVYLRTIDEAGSAVDVRLLEQTASAIINTLSAWAGSQFGVAGLERGMSTREGQSGWLTVKWSTSGVCGTTNGIVAVEGMAIVMNHRRPECTCGPLVAKHELGHAMGFYHTDNHNDLMATTFTGCDKPLSDREIFHARVAYTMALGSLDP